jgi:Domain of unknown function (DUF4399)
MRIFFYCLVAVFTLTLAMPAAAQRTKAPDTAKVYLISPANGETVSNPVTVRFGLSGMGIAPAGVEHEGTGHHHLLIDVDPATINFEESLPSDDNHRHFGGGQTEATIELPAGTHTLILLLGDQNHIPHDPPIMSDPVTITVK